jgi:ABC-type dipeptide/oligopeptide/nickel transport system permease subunit
MTTESIQVRTRRLEAATLSPTRLAWRRFLKHRLAVTAAVVMLAILILVYVVPLVVPMSPDQVALLDNNQPPSLAHLLGTDATGRDMFARMLYGGRVSIGVGLASAFIAVAIGSILGAIAGLAGGWADTVIMRVSEVFMSFPATVITLILAGIFGPSVGLLIVGLGVFQWFTTCRIVRGVVLTVREREYIKAAQAVGARRGWLLSRHLLPAAFPQLAVVFTLTVANSILGEAGLSFLGAGVVPPTPSWGNLLSNAEDITVLSSEPWLWVPPGIAIALVVLCVNFIGDGLRDAIDPKQR